MFDINDYYLGVILPTQKYYQSKNYLRYFQGESFDPFYQIPPQLAMITGVATLLHKVESNYYDEYNSIYKNELAYQLGKINNLGIVLAFAKPFQTYYKEEPVIYTQEELENNYFKMEEAFENHAYYITQYKRSKTYAIVQLDMAPMNLVYYDYLQETKKNNGFQYKK